MAFSGNQITRLGPFAIQTRKNSSFASKTPTVPAVRRDRAGFRRNVGKMLR